MLQEEIYSSLAMDDEEESKLESTDSDLHFPVAFLEYAAKSLFIHTRLAGPRIEALIPLFSKFFGDSSHYRAWKYLADLFNETPVLDAVLVLHVMANHRTVDLLSFTDIVNSSSPTAISTRLSRYWLRTRAAVLRQHRLILIEPVQARDNQGYTLLHLAALGSCKEFAMLWRQFSKEIDVFAEDGVTPLHCAAHAADGEFVQMLLDWGADPNGRSHLLGTPSTLQLDVKTTILQGFCLPMEQTRTSLPLMFSALLSPEVKKNKWSF